MNEQEKAAAGLLYDANNDEKLIRSRLACKDLCARYNQLLPSRTEEQRALMRQILGKIGGDFTITTPFWCDYGSNIEIGINFYTNHNCVILDSARITFGDNVFIGPNCCITAAGHPLDAEQRASGLEIALPVTIGDNVWLGAGVTVLPGVTIGAGAVIGAGCVVNRDIPENVIAAGNPCRVIRGITQADRERYRRAEVSV